MDKKTLLNKMENKELEEKSLPITTTEKKKNQKIQDELQPEKNLQNITKKREKQKSRANRSRKIKKFQKKTKMKFQKKDHFY